MSTRDPLRQGRDLHEELGQTSGGQSNIGGGTPASGVPPISAPDNPDQRGSTPPEPLERSAADKAASKIEEQIVDRTNPSGIAEESSSSSSTLQEKAQNLTQNARSGMGDAATQVVDQVKGTMDETVSTVKQNVDLRQHIEQRPLVSLGVAFVGGFMLGGLTRSKSGQHHQAHWPGNYNYPYPPAGGYERQTPTYHEHRESSPEHGESSSEHGSAIAQGIRSAAQKTGLEETISNAAAALIGNLTDQVKSTMDQNFPGFSERMKSAQSADGGFAEKSKEAQDTTL
jgi:ElaB/YqjD/DUF883 family membrane-anchored ribosome-binding protein